MTEEEAKTKACCGPPAVASALLLARPDVEAEPIDGLKWGLCIGSACMAWRHTIGTWVSPHGAKALALAARPEDADAEWVMQGYCGLAGAPQ